MRSNGEKNYAKESIFGPRRRFMSGWPANPGCQRLVRTGFRPLRPSRAAPEVEIGPNSSGMDQNALRSGSFGTFQASDTLAYSKKFLRYYAKAEYGIVRAVSSTDTLPSDQSRIYDQSRWIAAPTTSTSTPTGAAHPNIMMPYVDGGD